MRDFTSDLLWQLWYNVRQVKLSQNIIGAGERLVLLVVFVSVAFRVLAETDAALVRQKADDAWRQLTTNVLHPKTGILSDGIAPDEKKPGLRCDRYFPTPAEIAKQFPNPAGWGTAMEDGVLHTVPMLLAALARHRALGDGESAAVARRIFVGLKRCVEVPGNGFLARNISPFDLKSFYWNCSRDQYTQWVYGMWRYFKSPLASEKDRTDVARLVKMVAAYHEKNVTAATEFNSVRYDGHPAIYCRMWVADPFKKPVVTAENGGSVDGLCAHEVLRLHEIYLAAWVVSGERHWKDLYDGIIEGGLHIAELPLRKNLAGFTSFQMQLSQRLLWEEDPDPVRKQRLLALLTRGAGCAAYSFQFTEKGLAALKGDVSAPMTNWRKQKMVYMNSSWFRTDDFIGGFPYLLPDFSGDYGTAYSTVREFGEGLCDRQLAPGLGPSAELDAKFDELMAKIDFRTHCSSGAVYPLLAYWWRVSPE